MQKDEYWWQVSRLKFVQGSVTLSVSPLQSMSSIRNPLGLRLVGRLDCPWMAPRRSEAASPCLGRWCGMRRPSPRLPRAWASEGAGTRWVPVGRSDVAFFQSRELLALLDQVQELRQSHGGRSLLGRRQSSAPAADTATLVHVPPPAHPHLPGPQALPGGVGATTFTEREGEA